MRKILIATDFSHCSEVAVDLAVELAVRYGAALALLHVIEVPSAWYFGGGVYVPPTDLVEDLEKDAHKGLAATRERISGKGVVITTKAVTGDPAHEIVEYARNHGCDLIVVGSHGRRGLKRFFLGSVAEKVLRTAEVPVLTARVPQASQPAAATQSG